MPDPIELPQRDPEISAFVESMGDLFAQTGQARIAGRVVGWLLVCDPPHQSAADLEAAIGASKASISTVTRRLVALGLAETLGLPGDRRTYFQIRPGAWTDLLRTKSKANDWFAAAARRGLEALGDDAPPERRARLDEMERFHRFFHREMTEACERWAEAERNRGRTDG